jgi:hypothetical protein
MCDWGPAFIFTCTISSCFWLLVFFLHHTFATSFSHLPKLFYIFFANFTNIPWTRSPNVAKPVERLIQG